MATTAEWVEGARPRTLPAALSPVVVGTGVAIYADAFVWWKSALALVVALALQVGVNYANDYSDGVRGTDEGRVGPMRLVGSRAATPSQVKAAAFTSFSVAALAGLVLALTSAWWLLLVGAVAIAAAWYYTGGSRPYGYRGLGEVSVFVFFGFVAVAGTAYVQVGELGDGVAWVACGVGVLAVAILVANNLRDIPTDVAASKRTLAVLIGDEGSRRLFSGLHLVAYAFAVVAAGQTTWWLMLAALSLPLSARAQLAVHSGATGRALIPVLRDTGLTELVYALGLFTGYVISAAG
ncbi:MAG: 1,4-dihydroxy-2-naphthoate polyprenyltransferase [Propionibacteriales bacterium]|nr:1,4-dihydroxy-2-naphthoate polyprenyltransferase [Propionibacteriales bacterium]